MKLVEAFCTASPRVHTLTKILDNNFFNNNTKSNFTIFVI